MYSTSNSDYNTYSNYILMDYKKSSEIYKEIDTNLRVTELIKPKLKDDSSNVKISNDDKYNQSTNITNLTQVQSNKRSNNSKRVKFSQNIKEVILIQSFKKFNLQNVFEEPNYSNNKRKSFNCKCLII